MWRVFTAVTTSLSLSSVPASRAFCSCVSKRSHAWVFVSFSNVVMFSSRLRSLSFSLARLVTMCRTSFFMMAISPSSSVYLAFSSTAMVELAKKIIWSTGSKSEFLFCDLPHDDPKQRQPDIGKAKAQLNWEPEVPLDEGFRVRV